MIKKIRYFFVLLLIVSNILAQSTSSFLKDAEKKKELKKYEEAIELYSKVIALKPANRDALEGRSYCYLQVKNYEKAVDDYKFLVNIKPHNNEYILGLADSYLLAGKIKSSIEYYQRALSEDNNNLICYEKLIMYERCRR
jgi:tetratricopeptide (TPR) repeat protein